MGDQARAMLEPGAYLLQVFMAGSQFEAGTIRNRILGLSPTDPNGKNSTASPIQRIGRLSKRVLRHQLPQRLAGPKNWMIGA
jgi:hypothetical protein